MWGHFKDWVLKAYDDMCEKKWGMGSKEDTWWWNEEMKEAFSRRKDAHKAMCRNSTKENKRWYKSMNNKAKKAVSKATGRGRRGPYLIQNCQNRMFRLEKGLMTDSKEVEGDRCV